MDYGDTSIVEYIVGYVFFVTIILVAIKVVKDIIKPD